MRQTRWATCLWPGLAPLWVRGSWSGLATAVAFALLLDFTLLATLVWTELLGPLPRNVAWLTVGSIWVASLPVSFRWLMRQHDAPQAERTGDLFKQAQNEYLQGHWLETQAALDELLARDPRDAEARLMMASLLRHTGRIEEARQALKELERYDGAARWRWEIASERARLKQMETDAAEEQSEALLSDAA